MNILYIGFLSNIVHEGSFFHNSAGLIMQRNYIKEIEKKNSIDIISIESIPLFVKSRILFNKKSNYFFSKSFVTSIPFVNIRYLKQISQSINLFFHVITRLKKCDYILTYNFYPIINFPLLVIKFLTKKKVYSILADIPDNSNMDFEKNYSKCIKSLSINFSNFAIKKLSGSVVLSRYTINKYNLKNSIVIENGVDSSLKFERKIFFPEKKIFVYSGGLTNYNNIISLIKGFALIEMKNVELHLYGAGDLAEVVNIECGKTNNVFYKGSLSNKEILIIQKNAFFLINPRIINSEVSKTTFPSKLFEYLISGTPVLTTKLESIPSEYDNFLNYTSGDLPQDFFVSISKLLDSDYDSLLLKAEQAFQYLIEKKNWGSQIEDFYEILNNDKKN